MRLEKIVLEGFKSFADKTEFVFDQPVTAIVGPNGCGKSNVVDAMKWVLGEQSVKSLRSGHMADVIFSGSSSRKPLGSAAVSIVLSNKNRTLAIDADEVQISRRIFKSGECEYRLNNKICRLKDIREMLMDTGLGVKAYAFIEQGQVERLLTASKQDRRVIFEEAAGISKYKAHKKEAIRKLDRTEQNLLRLADILNEVQKQLRSVKLAAGKARNYLEYTERLKSLQMNYSLAEYAKINAKDKEVQHRLGDLQQTYAQITADISKTESLISELGNQRIEAENDLNQTDNRLVSVQSKIEQQLQKIDFLQTRINEFTERKTALEKRIESMATRQQDIEQQHQQVNQELSENESILKDKQEQLTGLQDQAAQLARDCSAIASQLEDEKSGIIDIVRRTAQLHNELQSITVHRDTLASQKDRLNGRASSAKSELEALLTEKAQYSERHRDIESVLDELQQRLDEKQQTINTLEAQIVQQTQTLSQHKETKSALSSEFSILSDMQTRREGINQAVKEILNQRVSTEGFRYVVGLLADIIEADMRYSTAVEAALEGRADSLIVGDLDPILCDEKSITELGGRLHFIDASRCRPFSDTKDLSIYPTIRGRLAEFARTQADFQDLLWSLLGNVLIVDSLTEAVKLSKILGNQYDFVTPQGAFYSSRGVIKIGPVGKAEGLISRKSRLRQLEDAIDNIQHEIQQRTTQIAEDQQKKEHLVELCKELRTAVYEANTEKMQSESKMGSLEQQIQRLRKEQPLITGEIDVLESQIAQSVKKEYESKQQLEELETVNQERSTHIEKLQADLEAAQTQQRQIEQQLADMRVESGQLRERQQSLKQSLSHFDHQMQQSRDETTHARAEIDECEKQSQQACRDILECESTVSDSFVEKEDRQNNSRQLHEQVESLLQQQRQHEHELRQKRQEQSQYDEKISELKVELGQLEVKCQDLVERVRDELSVELEEAFQQYGEQDVDWETVRTEMTELRGKIERLGNVNVDAIKEQEELEQRNEFLSTQVEDLQHSKHQLEQLIGRLNKVSREKFAETFEQVRLNFQEIFRKLFGGGKADILIEDTEDILEAGIEIMAKPPGKETRSIALLSGGEKSMTAIALLFSVFKSKPSPFCFLDEVDAALDEANNERFNQIIREFQKESQFIIITHAKRTMSMANVLFGITMQVRGVSKKISVKFDGVEEFQETAAA